MTTNTVSSIPLCTPKYCRQKSLIPVPLSPKLGGNTVRQWAVLPPPPRSKSSEKFHRSIKRPILSAPKPPISPTAKCNLNTGRFSETIKSSPKQIIVKPKTNPDTKNSLNSAIEDKPTEILNISENENSSNSNTATPLTYVESYSVRYLVQLNNPENTPKSENEIKNPNVQNRGNQTEFRKKSNIQMTCTCSAKDKFLCYIFENFTVVLGFIALIIISQSIPRSISFIWQTYKAMKPKRKSYKDYIYDFFHSVYKWVMRQRIVQQYRISTLH